MRRSRIGNLNPAYLTDVNFLGWERGKSCDVLERNVRSWQLWQWCGNNENYVIAALILTLLAEASRMSRFTDYGTGGIELVSKIIS